MFFFFLKRQSLLRLSSPSIFRTRHLCPQTNQNLFHPHIPIPILRRWDLGINNFSRSRIDAVHVDFGDEAYPGGCGGIGFGDGDAQFVEAAVVLGLFMLFIFVACSQRERNDGAAKIIKLRDEPWKKINEQQYNNSAASPLKLSYKQQHIAKPIN